MAAEIIDGLAFVLILSGILLILFGPFEFHFDEEED